MVYYYNISLPVTYNRSAYCAGPSSLTNATNILIYLISNLIGEWSGNKLLLTLPSKILVHHSVDNIFEESLDNLASGSLEIQTFGPQPGEESPSP